MIQRNPNWWMRWAMIKKLIHRDKIKCNCGFTTGNYYDLRLHSTDCILLHAWRMAKEIVRITCQAFNREASELNCTCGWQNGNHAPDCDIEQTWQECEGRAIDAVMGVDEIMGEYSHVVSGE